MVTLDARAFRWVLPALFVSLGLNLFVGGVLAGRYLAPAPPEPSPAFARLPMDEDRPVQALVQRIAARLPAGERAAFVEAVSGHREAMAAAAGAVHEARRKVNMAMAAEPFDRAALDAAFAELRASSDQFRTAMHRAIADGVQGISVESRRHLAERDRRGRHRWPRGRPSPP